MPNTIIVTREGAIATIQLNRPHVRNALNEEVLTELGEAMQNLDDDQACRCIVLTGDEKAFASGADIKESFVGVTPVSMLEQDLTARWEVIRRIKTPIIAAVSGYALGGGCELAMICDIIVASETAKFGQPEINLGIIPGAGGTQRLTRAVGKWVANELILTGRFISAQEAKDIGLVVHVYPAAEELGRVYHPALPILSGTEHFAGAVRDLRVEPRWSEWSAAARADYEAWQQHDPMPGTLDLGDCIAHLRARVPDAIVTNGAGNFSAWVHRFWRWHDYPTQLAPTSGAMGYGVPAAVAAKLVAPERTVICFAGDGDFLMSGAELATAVLYELPIVVLIVNNGMYGTIRMHQERLYPGRVVGTDLHNPDFAAYAESFGAHGETIERTEEVEDAFERAIESGRPAVLDLRVDPEAISPRHTISELREAAR